MSNIFTVYFQGSTFHMLHDDEDMYQFKILHVEGRRLVEMACARVRGLKYPALTPLEQRAYDDLEQSFYQQVHSTWQQIQEEADNAGRS